MLLYLLGVIIYFGFWLLVIAGVVGLIMFIVFLAGYIGKREKKQLKMVLISAGMMTPIVLIGLTVGCSKLSTRLHNYNSIHYQMNSGTLEGMERLLKSGADPNSSWSDVRANTGEYTLLANLAFYNTHHDDTYERMKLLIEYGADVDWESCVNCRSYSNGAFHYDHGSTFCKYTPLMFVCLYTGDQGPEIVELLLENGANVNAKGYDGKNALDLINEHIRAYKDDGKAVPTKYLKIKESIVAHGGKAGTAKNRS